MGNRAPRCVPSPRVASWGFFVRAVRREFVLDQLRLGILFSTDGPYGALGRDCRDGAELALAHLAAEGQLSVPVETVLGDPACAGTRYVDLAGEMLRERGCRHVIGTVTSQARKDVLPLVEKHDGMLWYVCPYEGFEASDNVVYLGACPNQHLLPLFEHIVPRFGRRAFLLGANYIWGWEMNRLARELIADAGGTVIGERCLPVAETDVARLIDEIEVRRPDFILNNLIGPASHALLRAMRDLAARDSAFRPERCPVVSCDLTECELGEIGLGVADGQLAVASYFDSLDTPENRAFKASVAARFGAGRRVSSFFASAYAAVRLCVAAVAGCGTDDPVVVRAWLGSAAVTTPLGPLRIDPATHHAALPFHLGRIAGDGFTLVASRPAIVADPYLALRHRRAADAVTRPRLRIVS